MEKTYFVYYTYMAFSLSSSAKETGESKFVSHYDSMVASNWVLLLFLVPFMCIRSFCVFYSLLHNGTQLNCITCSHFFYSRNSFIPRVTLLYYFFFLYFYYETSHVAPIVVWLQFCRTFFQESIATLQVPYISLRHICVQTRGKNVFTSFQVICCISGYQN